MTHRLLVGGELALYGDVGDLWGDGNGFSARDVLDALSEFGNGPLMVRLNSGGGSAWDGVAIFNSLKAHPSPVTVLVDGIAASAASVIAMAGTEIVMREGSQMMIHDPSAVTMGTAQDHSKSADVLNRLGDTISEIYAGRTGAPVAEMRAAMVAETWMNAEEAVAFKFATSTDAAPAAAVAAFDYRVYMRAPEVVMQASSKELPVQPVAPATIKEEPRMAAEKTVVAADDKATEPVAKDHSAEILARCAKAKLSINDAHDIVAAAGGDLQKGMDAIINKIADRDPDQDRRPSVTALADENDKWASGIEESILARAGLGGKRNEFTSMSLREIARDYLNRTGQKNQISHDPLVMVGAALRPMMSSGQHSTSDFVEVLANVANKSMLKGYAEADETFQQWTAVGSASDFKALKRVDVNLFPNLAEVPEGAEYSYGTIGDRGATVTLATYGKMFSITRQAIINDDLNAFTKIPMKMGRASLRTIGNMVYAILTANGNMPDGYALFSSQHKNLAGSAAVISATSIGKARAGMAQQKDPDSHAAGGFNIRPAFLVVPSELEDIANQVMNAPYLDAAMTPNTVANLAKVVSDARLSAASATAWYLAANPNAYDTIEVTYLNGQSQPTLEQKLGWDVDGLEFKVRIDAAVTALDFRGLYKNAGA